MKSVYTMSIRAETRYRIEESFGDFKTTDGVTMPTQYVLKYTQELQNGRTNLWEWDMADVRKRLSVRRLSAYQKWYKAQTAKFR